MHKIYCLTLTYANVSKTYTATLNPNGLNALIKYNIKNPSIRISFHSSGQKTKTHTWVLHTVFYRHDQIYNDPIA